MASDKLEAFARRYVRRFAGAGFAALAPVFVLNAVVDPYEILRDIAASDSFRRGEIHEDRITVPYAMRRARAEVLFAGSSRARYLVSSAGERTPDLALTRRYFGERRVFNAAVAGVNAHVLRRVVEHALHTLPLRQAVLLVDDVALNVHRRDGAGFKESRYAGGRYFESRVEGLGALLNVNMARTSLGTLLPTPETHAGSHALRPVEEEWRARLAEYYRADLYGCYELAGRAVEDVDAAVAQLRARGVEVLLMTPAIHATLLELVWRTGNWPNYRAYLQALTQIGARHGAAVWLFSPYAELAQPELMLAAHGGRPSDGPPHYADPGHATAILGRAMLSVATGLPPETALPAAGFGTPLTPASLPVAIERLERARTEYVASHPELERLLPAGPRTDCSALTTQSR